MKINISSRWMSLPVLLFVLASLLPAASIITNGSFEQGPAVGSFTNVAGGSNAITGWVVTGEGIDYIGSLWTSSDGAHSLDLDGSVPSSITPPFVRGGVAQTFATTSGTEYLVTFDLAGNVNAGPLLKLLQVSVAGITQDFSFDITGKNGVNMGWTTKSFSFFANAPSTTLEFASAMPSGQTGWGPAIDNVSVEAVGGTGTSEVPEPSSILLMATGLIGLATARRLRRL